MKVDSNNNTWKDYARLFLDLPYRSGIKHIKIAMGIDREIVKIGKKSLSIDPSYLTIRKRAYHILIGIAELIPIIGIFVTLKVELLKSRQLDEHKLVKSTAKIEPHQKAWYLNLALLQSAYQKSKGAQKKQIKFLAANYLNNVTPKSLNRYTKGIKNKDLDYSYKYQGTPLDEYCYHRECLVSKVEYGKEYNNNLAYGNDSLFILTDTVEVEHLFPLKYTVINDKTAADSYTKIIKDTLSAHFQSYDKSSPSLRLPFLIDITKMLSQTIQTRKDRQAEQSFIKEFKELKKKIESAADEAIEQLINENSELKRNDLKKIFNNNITCISRVEIDSISGIKMLPIGSCSSKLKQFRSPFISFVINNGIYIGAVNLQRKVTYDVFKQRPDVSYAVPENIKNEMVSTLYSKKEDFTKGFLFQRLQCLFSSKPIPVDSSCGIAPLHLKERIEFIDKKPHLKVLGKATVDLLQGAFQEIDENKWAEINKDPIFSQILQTSLLLAKEYLAAAEQSALADNFNQFAQEIELVHAQLSIVLELFKPFRAQDFGEIYKKELLNKAIPADMESLLQAGLAKTAVNIFSGMAAAMMEKEGSVKGVFSQGSYFEETIHMEHFFDYFVTDKSIPKRNFYLGQFNSNVDVGSTLTEYKKRDVASDIRRLLNEDRVTENFTVAIDLTIEDFHSSNVKELLLKFQKEIDEGKINFVFFSSGQKFYTMGMDNYYGAYFYTVNNRCEKWKNFDSLFTHPAYKIDDLSAQWFCLATKYAPDSLSEYRQLIFKNTRNILDRMPPFFNPDSSSKQLLRVSKVEKEMASSFIDLKVIASPKRQLLTGWRIKNKFYDFAKKTGIKPFFRGSFGFFHVNFALFGHLDNQVRTIRINPGINPEENDKIVNFFKTLEKK